MADEKKYKTGEPYNGVDPTHRDAIIEKEALARKLVDNDLYTLALDANTIALQLKDDNLDPKYMYYFERLATVEDQRLITLLFKYYPKVQANITELSAYTQREIASAAEAAGQTS